jgi:TRAP-type transport system periplasmic protein
MKAEKSFHVQLCAVVFAVLIFMVGSTSLVAAAEKFTLNCIAAWPKSMLQVEFFNQDFTDRIQKEADKKYPGELKLVFKGGPEIVAQNEQIIAVGKGVVDMLYTTPSYYLSKMPELDIWNVTPLQSWEERAVGLNDYVDKLHNQKTNTHFLVRSGSGISFQFGLVKPVKTLNDFRGLSVRVNPTVLPLVKELGMIPVTMSPADLYTGLERGVVNSYIMPAFLMRSFGVDKVTKYLLYPGFLETPNVVLVNLDTWKKLPKHLQDFLTEQADIHGRNVVKFNHDYEKKELDSYKAAGMVFVELPKADGDALIKLANDSVTKVVMEKAPDEAKKILEYFAKNPVK